MHRPQIILRLLQLVFITIAMALVGNMISETVHESPSTLNYTLYATAFSVLTLLYLFPAAIWDAAIIHPSIPLIIDILNVIFLLCAAVAVPSKLHAHSCNNKSYIDSNGIARGSSTSDQKRCREGQALSAFLWFAWATWVVSLVFSSLAMRGTVSKEIRGARPGRRTQMSEI